MKVADLKNMKRGRSEKHKEREREAILLHESNGEMISEYF